MKPVVSYESCSNLVPLQALGIILSQLSFRFVIGVLVELNVVHDLYAWTSLLFHIKGMTHPYTSLYTCVCACL